MKGILICLVILHHIPYETISVSKIPNDTFHWLGTHGGWYACFFMPAFFMITGLCSNFDKPFGKFFLQNLRTILLPGLVFDLLFYTTPRMLASGEYVAELIDFGLRFKSLGGYYWFLVSLFLAKIFYWGLHKLHISWYRWALLGISCLLGFVIKHYNLIYNHWSICQTLDLTLFLAIGQWLKSATIDRERLSRYCLWIFIGAIAICYATGLKIPHVTAAYRINEWWQLPVHVLLATLGSLALLNICQRIGSNRVLEYLGQGSLVIYMIHSFVIKFLLNHFGYWLTDASIVASILMFVLMFVIVTALSAGFAWLFQQKYLHVLLGK